MNAALDSHVVLELFRETGALLEGHFLLSSGLHSERYFQCALVLERPAIAERLAAEFARQVRVEITQPIDVVIGPALGAVTWAYEVARALGARAQFSERKDDAMELRRGFVIKPGDSVLVVEDVFTTGGSAREVLELLKTFDVRPVATGCIVNRSGGNPFERDGLACFQLAALDVKSWKAEECPLCKAGGKAIKPGSRAKLAS
jgi:orotate phosphoribosyltransferase